MGVLCVGGSDAPVESFDILDNIYYAVTREKLKGGPEGGWLPQYKLPVDEAIRLFTSYAAKSCFYEDRLGMLKPGYLADLVVLEEDLYAVEPHHIKDVKVLRTVCGGKTVYEA
jgi:predicted amidohydrolase YtcJ